MTEPTRISAKDADKDIVAADAQNLTDVAIIGGGPAGALLALALGGAGLKVTVIDRDAARGKDDGRVYALAAGSRRVLAGLGLWDGLCAGAQPIVAIDVSDGPGPVLVHLANDVPPGVAGNTGEPLGQIVASTDLTAALGKVISAHPGITLLGGAEMRDIDFGPTRARVHLADGTAIDAMLVIGADGRRSAVRRAARINVTEWSYGQAAIVTRIAHELPHHDRAAERFLAGGAFAVLPLPDGPGGEHYSSVVWTETAELVGDLMQLGKDDFNAELNARLGPRLGAARAVGRRWTYPLALTLAENYIGHRLALIGDAAHAIHPIAGQGLNLGIRDVAALAEVIVDAYRLGLDFGMKTALVDYQRWRRFDNTMLAAATDLLDRLFRSRLAPLRVARQIGMALFARSAPARRAFLGETMGLAGDLPRLSRGERL